MNKIEIKFRDINNKVRSILVDINTKELDLNSLGIVTIKAHTFIKLKKLKTLWLYNNNLNTLHAETFTGLINLERLFLYHNKIHKISNNLFFPLVNLRVLELSMNKLTELDERSFSNNKKLEKLVLDFNRLSYLPQNLFLNLKSLHTLILSSNNISTLPETIFINLFNLKFISLSFNSIGHLSKNLFNKNFSLLEIRMDNNPIKVIDMTSFQFLPRLNKVDILYCNILEQIRISPITENIHQVSNAKIDFSMTSLKDPPPLIVERGLRAVVEHLSPNINKKTSLSDVRLQFGIPSAVVKVDKCILCKQQIKESDRNICLDCEEFFD